MDITTNFDMKLLRMNEFYFGRLKLVVMKSYNNQTELLLYVTRRIQCIQLGKYVNGASLP